TLAGANVTNVTVTCTTNTHTIGGTVGGLSGTGLVLQNNGGDNLTVLANGAFTFSTAIASGSPYAVTVLTQPTHPSQTCTVTNVTNVNLSCAITQPSTITVSISPKLRGLTTSQTQLFNATVANDLGNAGVTWTSTGGSFANPTMTSVAFSSAAAGSFTITATSV